MAKTVIYSGTTAEFFTATPVELSDGTLIAPFISHITSDLTFYYSTDDGDSWALATGDITDARDPYESRLTVDEDDVLWLAYTESTTDGKLVRGTFSGSTITWDSGFIFDASGPSGLYAIKRVPIGTSDYIGIAYSASGQDAAFLVVKRTSGGTYSLHKAGTELHQGTVNDVNIDYHHTGDGLTVASSAPHFYIGCNDIDADDYYFWRVAHSSTDTWTIGSKRTITASKATGGDIRTANHLLFDGTRVVMIMPYNVSPYYAVFERDEADTTTIERTGMQALESDTKTGSLSLSVDAANQDIYVFGFDSNIDPVYEKYDRAGDSWDGSLSVIDNTTVTTIINVRIHSSQFVFPDDAHVYWRDVDGSAYFYYTSPLTLNDDPTTPTWNTTDNDTADINNTLTLDWNFNDPNVGDTQSAYTVRRKLGSGGAWDYWTGAVWQASEDGSTKIAASGEELILASAWGLDADATHYYGVKLWDSADAGPSPWSADVRVIPSEAINPTIITPTPSGTPTVGASNETVEWTLPSSGTKYRVVVSDVSSLSDMEAGTLDYDTGIVVDNVTIITSAEFPTNTVTRYVRVVTYNAEGLISAIDEVDVLVSWSPPSIPTLVITTDDAADKIITTITNPGLLATETHNDIYRRVVGDSGVGIRIGITVPVNGVFDDYAVKSGIAYEYLVIAFGDNGTQQDSAWVA